IHQKELALRHRLEAARWQAEAQIQEARTEAERLRAQADQEGRTAAEACYQQGIEQARREAEALVTAAPARHQCHPRRHTHPQRAPARSTVTVSLRSSGALLAFTSPLAPRGRAMDRKNKSPFCAVTPPHVSPCGTPRQRRGRWSQSRWQRLPPRLAARRSAAR